MTFGDGAAAAPARAHLNGVSDSAHDDVERRVALARGPRHFYDHLLSICRSLTSIVKRVHFNPA